MQHTANPPPPESAAAHHTHSSNLAPSNPSHPPHGSVLALTPRSIIVDIPAQFGMIHASSGRALFDSGRGRRCCTVDAAIGSVIAFILFPHCAGPKCVIIIRMSLRPQASSFVSSQQHSAHGLENPCIDRCGSCLLWGHLRMVAC
ncbi:hypothetical protein Hypma_004488 [Hypsizygus marmoreus]|uniref:Uncharacterized protein n=1 Tax=Hypsizygus marmoreus TaxID=39966 RepID=A0A369JYF0_HYPMA|nr:hypothetical protein Hypma_004488 [Hypsizygus marmoreus]